MKLIQSVRRFFRREKQHSSSGGIELIQGLEKICENIAKHVFHEHSDLIVRNELQYIVASVWGISPEGELDAVQKKIHRNLSPRIYEALTLLGVQQMTAKQSFAVEYLIKGYVISKLSYMREKFINMVRTHPGNNTSNLMDLSTARPIGEA